MQIFAALAACGKLTSGVLKQQQQQQQVIKDLWLTLLEELSFYSFLFFIYLRVCQFVAWESLFYECYLDYGEMGAYYCDKRGMS